MNLEEYQQQQQEIVNELSLFLLTVLRTFLAPALSPLDWLSVLSIVFPRVQEARRRSAELGRLFYDFQRRAHSSEPGRFDRPLTDYKFTWFEEAMQPAREKLSRPGATEDDLSEFVLRVAKEVENGGRRQILNMVEEDPVVRGWARVATGRETCAFCMMMVSRGPVYLTAEGAGLGTSDKTALELINSGDEEALNRAMRRWHPGCDCKVVPVFRRDRWPGRAAYLRAEKLWIEATKGYKGKDALNALRRALNDGEISPSDFAAAA